MLRAVIFDVDGTLVNSVDAHAHAWVHALAEFHHHFDFKAVRHQIGKGGDQLLKAFLSPAEIEREGKSIEDRRKAIFARQFLPAIRGFPKARELFKRILADGHQVALASSAAGEELEVYKERAGIADLIETEITKDDAEKSKPHPDIFQAALAGLNGVRPEEAFVIGDTPWDVIAADRAGLRTIAVLSGGFAEAELREAGSVAIYPDVAALIEGYDDSPLAEPKL